MEQYDKKYFADLEKGERVELPRNLRILQTIESFKKSGKILDVGIGTGLFLRLAKKHGWQTFGVDASNYAYNRVRKYGHKLFKGDLEDVDFENNLFDAINMRHVIEHIPDPKKALIKAYKILKPGGIICIATPDSFGFHAKIFGKDWPHLSLPYHLHFFSKNSLSKLVEDSGFEVLQIETEELTIYDIFKLLLFKLGFPIKYQNPTLLSFKLNNLLAKFGFGEGIVIVAKRPK